MTIDLETIKSLVTFTKELDANNKELLGEAITILAFLIFLYGQHLVVEARVIKSSN